jgi:hypothetical protein
MSPTVRPCASYCKHPASTGQVGSVTGQAVEHLVTQAQAEGLRRPLSEPVLPGTTLRELHRTARKLPILRT